MSQLAPRGSALTMIVLVAAALVVTIDSSAAYGDDSYLQVTATADAVSVGAIVLSGVLLLSRHGLRSSKKTPAHISGLFYLGVGGLVLGTPIVHAAKGNWRQGLVSAGLRMGVPLSGHAVWKGCLAVSSDESSSSTNQRCSWLSSVVTVGALTASLIHDIRVARRGPDQARPIL